MADEENCTITETTYEEPAGGGGGPPPEPESYTDRVKASCGMICLGLVLFFGSFGLLGWNEKRAVERYDALNEGESQVQTINGNAFDPTNEGKLIHFTAEVYNAEGPLIDPIFNIQTSGLKLYRDASMYQWKEDATTKTTTLSDGTKKKDTTYSWKKDWYSSWIDSSKFKDCNCPTDHSNPSSMEFTNRNWMATAIKIGSYDLPARFRDEIDWSTSLVAPVGNVTDSSIQNRIKLLSSGGTGFYFGNSFTSTFPQVPTPATAPAPTNTVPTNNTRGREREMQAFLDCSLLETEEEKKNCNEYNSQVLADATAGINDPSGTTGTTVTDFEAGTSSAPVASVLVANSTEATLIGTTVPGSPTIATTVSEAGKIPTQAVATPVSEPVASPSKTAVNTPAAPTNPMVGDQKVSFRETKSKTFTIMGVQTGQSLQAWVSETGDGGEISFFKQGAHSSEVLFDEAEASNNAATWALRFVGFLMMAIGLYIVFRPLVVMTDVIPCVGSVVGCGIKFMSVTIAAVLSMLTISIAWLVVHPKIGGTVLAVSLAVIGICAFVFKKFFDKEKDVDDSSVGSKEKSLAVVPGSKTEALDLNKDGKVDSADVKIAVEMAKNSDKLDLNNDGKVDGKDAKIAVDMVKKATD